MSAKPPVARWAAGGFVFGSCGGVWDVVRRRNPTARFPQSPFSLSEVEGQGNRQPHPVIGTWALPGRALRLRSVRTGVGKLCLLQNHSSPARGGGRAKLVEGCLPSRGRITSPAGTPLRLASGQPPPLPGEESMMPAKRDFYFLLEHDDMRLTHPSPSGEGSGVRRLRKRAARGEAPPQPLP